MDLAPNTTVALSCEASEEKSGPTIVHSTGVKGYRIQPELIQMLQQAFTNNKLTDHEKGVFCKEGSARVLDVFSKAGYTVTTQSKTGSRKYWLLTKTGGGSSDAAPAADENEGNADEAEDEGAGGEEEAEPEEE